MAAKAKVPVVPVTLVNTGDLMPNGHEGLLYSGHVKVRCSTSCAPPSPLPHHNFHPTADARKGAVQ